MLHKSVIKESLDPKCPFQSAGAVVGATEKSGSPLLHLFPLGFLPISSLSDRLTIRGFAHPTDRNRQEEIQRKGSLTLRSSLPPSASSSTHLSPPSKPLSLSLQPSMSSSPTCSYRVTNPDLPAQEEALSQTTSSSPPPATPEEYARSSCPHFSSFSFRAKKADPECRPLALGSVL